MNDIIKHCKSIAEFGGPSPLFEDLYKIFPDIDGFNIFENNYWQKEFNNNYKGTGKQFNQDVVELDLPPTYDLIICSHVIEHIANPLKAINNWIDSLKEGGFIYSIIPYYKLMFDCKRPLTTLEHLYEDFIIGTEEDDGTHIKEALDLFENNGGYDFDNYIKSSKDNFKYRAIHHHVFDEQLVYKMFSFFGFDMIYQKTEGMHIKTLVCLK